MKIPRKLSRFFLAFSVVAAVAVETKADEQQEKKIDYADQSAVSYIRLAARGGDFELAEQRLGKLKKNNLKAMGNMALAVELAAAGKDEAAEERYEEALDLVANEEMLVRERVSAYLQMADLMKSSGEYQDEAEEMFDRAVDAISQLAGIDFDLAITEMVYVSLKLFEDKEQALELALLINNEKWRDDLIETLELAEDAEN